ncbi:MAG: hypothetical protein WC460_03885 [Patescibacteria group bacterium]
MAKSSTQKYLDIAEIREDTVILKDGTLRSVILCSSINFALKSEEEQNALIFGYIEFLNSLDHPMQIVIQSRKLEVDNYLRRLREAQRVQTNELLKIQIASYIDYIQELIEIGEIMTKKFFIIIPYNPLGDKTKSFWSRLSEVFSASRSIKIKKEKFLGYKEALNLRLANVQTNLKGMGLDSAVLDTQSLIELYYSVYNPKTSQNQKLRDISQLGIER